jgi:DNA-binding NarL/FixJ family response regulator
VRHRGHPSRLALKPDEGDVQALRAIKAGAVAYLLKSSLRKELVDTIRDAHAGRRRLSPEIADTIAVHDERLSEREIEILLLVSEGCANKEIAGRLSISEQTVKAYLKSIFGKLDASDRTHAVTLAARRGIITL